MRLNKPLQDDEAKADSSSQDSEAQALGCRIRAMRTERQQSLQEVARSTGLSASMLSLIERGLATPSVRSLRLLSKAFVTPMDSFFRASSEGAEDSPYIAHPSEHRRLDLTSSKITKTLLTPIAYGVIELYEITVNPGGSSGVEFIGEQGEKAGVVLSGTLRLWLNEKAYTLREGDSFRFPANIPHRFDNPGNQVASLYWIVNAKVT